MKKAIITVKLVPEATKVSVDQIKREIRDNFHVSWAEKIDKIEIVNAPDSL